MRLGGPAAFLTDVNSKQDVIEAVEWATQRRLPLIMIGSGSNIVWSDDGFGGLVLVNKILGFENQQIDDDLYITVGAGENWDDVVARTVDMGYSGLEQLSLIPGTAGATPVQNVGAYGREIADVLVTLQAYDMQTRQFVTIRADECAFAYRTSIFKENDKGRYLIINITLHLNKESPKPPFYKALDAYFRERGITEYTSQIVREAVIAIRSNKLPDPAIVANNGSFFFNPIVEEDQISDLHSQYPDLVYWRAGNGQTKVSAAWLVEQAGFKGKYDADTGMATWDKQPLVLVNKNAQSSSQVVAFSNRIKQAVLDKFGIELQQEPEFVQSASI